MNHIAEEQFEDIMQGNISSPAHLDKCPECQNRLAEKQALARKLRSAFEPVQAGADLAERVRRQINLTDRSRQSTAPDKHARRTGWNRRIWSPLAAAAAILIVAVPVGLYLNSTSQVKAAQAELFNIHQQNLGPHREFYSEDNPEKLAEYFKSKLGFTPTFPCTGQGLAIRGCCVAHFRGRIVGSYVVDSPSGVLSVIVVTDTPKSMGMTRLAKKATSNQTLWEGSFARCNMVTVRRGEYSYCAVGEVSHELLTDLIGRLLP